MEALWQDIRYGFRMLIKNPGFTLTVLVVLTLAIGTNTVVFSVINAVLFKPLPYDEPDRIVRIWEQKKQQGIDRIGSSHTNLIFWREHNQVFECIAGMQNRRAYITGLDKSYHVKAAAVSSCYFSLMGVRPMLGRGFLPEEELPGKEYVTVLSHSFWRARMGGDPEAIGKNLTLDGKEYTIVGIMGPDFRDSLTRDRPFWVPLVLDPEGKSGGTGVRARLKPGVTIEQAQANMTALEERLVEMYPKYNTGYTVEVQSFLDDELGDNRTLLHLLWGAVGLVLLVACTNAAGLFLVHGNVRQKELAVRSALGASRSRIICQMLTEGLMLSLVAGILGFLAAFWVVRGFVILRPADIPRIDETKIDMSVLFFTFGISLLTGLLFSLMPAWKAAGVHLSQTIKGTVTNVSISRRWHHLRGGLVIVQMSIALTLLMGVGMLIQSLIYMQKEDLGFEPDNVLVTSIELPKAKYPDYPAWTTFYMQLLERVQTLPEVQSAAIVSGGLDLSTGGGFMRFKIDGRPPVDQGEQPMARFENISPDFFKTMGMKIVTGRDFTEQDIQSGTRNIIIDEHLANTYFYDANPVGQRIDGMLIVGVVSTIRDFDELVPSINTIYMPIQRYCYQISDLVVKTDGDPLRLTGALRAQVSILDKDQEISEIETLKASLSDMLAPRRFTTILLGVFAQITLVLAVVGLYGLIHYTVTQSTHDIGIRMAIGATQARVTKTILGKGVMLILPGIILGLAGGYIVSRFITGLLYQTSPTDLGILLIVSATLFVSALIACFIPAMRAAKIDPMEALRYE